MKLDRQLYERLFETVKPLLCSGRPGDYTHIKNVYRMLVSLCESERYLVNPRVLITAGILHDCGYGFIKKKYMPYVTGQQKISAMKKAANDMTLAYIPVVLSTFSFTEKEISNIVGVVRYSDDEQLSIQNPSMELQILHDINLYDRFFPHRLKTLEKLYPDSQKSRTLLARSLEHILLPEFRERASIRMQNFLEKK